MGDSDVEDGMEKFEVTDADLQFTFNTNRRRQTKNQATYGIYLSLLGGGGGEEKDILFACPSPCITHKINIVLFFT